MGKQAPHPGGNPHPSGRWPANLFLEHQRDCEMTGTKKIAGHAGYPNGPGGKSMHYSSEARGVVVRSAPWHGHADSDGTETVTIWNCADGCSVRDLNEQGGNRPSTLVGRADPTETHEHPAMARPASWFGSGGVECVYADNGGASRYFVQFKANC